MYLTDLDSYTFADNPDTKCMDIRQRVTKNINFLSTYRKPGKKTDIIPQTARHYKKSSKYALFR